MRTDTITTLLLDLDGVLMDERSASRQAMTEWLGERATVEIQAAWFAARQRRLAEWRAGTATFTEQRRRRLRDVLPLLGESVGTPEELDRLFEAGYLAGYRRAWRAFDDAAPALAALCESGIDLAVLTNGAEQQQRDKLAAIGLADVVGPVFTAEGLGVSKPDPVSFSTACDQLDVDPDSVLYVGDEYEVDVLGARSAGLQAILLDRLGTAPPEEREVIHSLAELPPLLAP